MAPGRTWPACFSAPALLDYALYRQYFPLHALGLYERRRLARQPAVKPPRRTPWQRAEADRLQQKPVPIASCLPQTMVPCH